MAQEIKYYVIGGQYDAYNYGGATTIDAAKRIAANNEEYWDNWQGWHRPRIYKAEDCEIDTNFFGTEYYPKVNAQPYMAWDRDKKEWYMCE